jgi:hypothetical protein
LSYRVYDAGVKKQLLRDITGHFDPQQLSVLMVHGMGCRLLTFR